MFVVTVCDTNRAALPTAVTLTKALADGDPNNPRLLCRICHWKLYVPTVPGAVTVKLKVTRCPGATGAGTGRRLTLQVRLVSGFCATNS